MIPSRLLDTELTQIRPATEQNGYGDPSLNYDQPPLRMIRASLAHAGRGREVTTGGRDAIIADWLIVTDERDLHPRDRLQSPEAVFEIVGPVQFADNHTVALLRTVSG